MRNFERLGETASQRIRKKQTNWAVTVRLVKFDAEVRRADGKPYPPNRYAVDFGVLCVLVTDPKLTSSGFARFRDTLDSCMKELKATGNLKRNKPSQSPLM